MNVNLEHDEVERIVELLREQRDGVENGSIAPGQPRGYELMDIDALLAKLEA